MKQEKLEKVSHILPSPPPQPSTRAHIAVSRDDHPSAHNFICEQKANQKGKWSVIYAYWSVWRYATTYVPDNEYTRRMSSNTLLLLDTFSLGIGCTVDCIAIPVVSSGPFGIAVLHKTVGNITLVWSIITLHLTTLHYTCRTVIESLLKSK